MKAHELKCRAAEFDAVWNNRKTHEIRKADRPYEVWDRLYLREYDPNTKKYSGRFLEVEVTYLTKAGDWGLPQDTCVLSVRVVERHLATDSWEEYSQDLDFAPPSV